MMCPFCQKEMEKVFDDVMGKTWECNHCKPKHIIDYSYDKGKLIIDGVSQDEI